MRATKAAAAAALAGLCVAGCGPDSGQIRRCERVVAAFEGGSEVTIVRRDAHPGAGPGVVIDYRAPRRDAGDGRSERVRDSVVDLTDGAGEEHWVACRFGGGALSAGRLDLVEVSSDRAGRLSGVDLAMLRIWLRLEGER